VNVAELLEQVERQRAIIQEQARQMKQAEQVVSDANEYLEALRAWLDAIPTNKKEVTNVI
jgi:predicted ATP-grasp superfamily ATP-dependent carboligase